MPIVVRCACGKEYHFKDECAGRRAKCPACGAILSVPGLPAGHTSEAAEQSAPLAAPPPADTVVKASKSRLALGLVVVLIVGGAILMARHLIHSKAESQSAQNGAASTKNGEPLVASVGPAAASSQSTASSTAARRATAIKDDSATTSPPVAGKPETAMASSQPASQPSEGQSAPESPVAATAAKTPYPEPDGGKGLMGLALDSLKFEKFFLGDDQKANSAVISALKEIAQQANPGGKADGKRIEERIKGMLLLLYFQGMVEIKAGISIKSFRDLCSQWRQFIQQKEKEKNELERTMKFARARLYGYATGNEKGNALLRVMTRYEVDNRAADNKALANLDEKARESVQATEEPWWSLAIMADVLGLHNCLKRPLAGLSRSLYPEKDLGVYLKEVRTKARVYDLWRQGVDISQIDTAEDLLKFEAQFEDWRKGIEEDRLLKQAVFYGFANGKEVGDARQRAIAKCQEEMTKAVAEAEAEAAKK